MTAAGGGRYCTFTLDGHLFGIEVERVQEVLLSHRMTPVPLADAAVRGLINLRGQIVTAFDLRRRLDLPDLPPPREPMHVVVRAGAEVVSLLVDEIGDVIETESSTFERPPETLQGRARELIRGAQKLHDRLLLLLDTDRALRGASDET
jgi:purine-binding chemotaxis protein CheW